MTPDQIDQLNAVNAEVNLVPYNATPGVGEPPDWWTDEPVAGNSWVCRDYTQMKADRLKSLGWAASALTEVFCWTEPPNSGYHAVLAVETDGETWIMDSRFPLIYRIDAPPAAYRWDRRQVVGTVEFTPIV